MPTIVGIGILAATFVVPAFAQNAPKKVSDVDEAFITGVRKIGVMAAQAFARSSEADQSKVGQAAINLATQVARHCWTAVPFGFRAAFVYSGPFGYRMEHDLTTRPVRRRSRISGIFKRRTWRGATAAPVAPFAPDHIWRSVVGGLRSDDGRLMLVQIRQRGGGGQRAAGRGAQRPAVNRGGDGFDSSDVHRNVSNTRNMSANRNANISGGDCCYGNSNRGPCWGGTSARAARLVPS
jgi:hypothetical protein